MISFIVENITSQQNSVLIHTSHSPKNSLDALNPTLSTIRIVASFEDRRFVVHEPFQSQFILSA
ncbi:hypothetical protein A2U01_0108158, partial [Trifolium medium]|nr:hypothetical protein [Trifolium medium]